MKNSTILSLTLVKYILIIGSFVLASTLTSCGLSEEEKKALETLKSRETTLTIELEQAQEGKAYWFDLFTKETENDYLKQGYADHYEEEAAIYDEKKAELAEVQFQISQLQ
jgi:hypothetical protein